MHINNPSTVAARICSWALLLSATAAGAPSCGDWRQIDDGLQATESPQVDIAPDDSVVFAGARLGGASREILVLSNTGAAPLRVREISLQPRGGDSEFELSAEDLPTGPGAPGACPLSGAFTLDTTSANPDGSACAFSIVHRPVDGAADVGRLLISTNDPVRPELSLALSAAASEPQLVLQPAAVDFGPVAVGETACRPVGLLNAGRAPLTIHAVELIGDADAQMTMILSPQGPHGALPAELPPAADGAPATGMEVSVCFEPRHPGPAQGRLRVQSDDPRDPAAVVVLSGGAVRHCVELLPADLDFGDVGLGQRAVQSLEVHNCGDLPLTLQGAELLDPGEGSSEDFSLDGEPAGLDCDDAGTVCAGAAAVLPGGSVDVLVAFTPMTEAPDGGRLRVFTDVPGAEEMDVLLFGRGNTNACPHVEASARIAGADAWEPGDPLAPLEALPLATLELRGDRSVDPDGQIARWQWSVIERPEDSRAQLAPHAGASNPTLFLDLAGVYVIELQVFDDQGLPGCAAARVVVEAIPRADVHVQLVWDTPGDPDQDDEGFAAGADLDLHVLHPLGDWFDLPFDCFYGNPNPDWARPGRGDDDPSLDRDDTDGAGPENINLSQPEQGRVYRVGVHYFNDHGYGPTMATVRLFVQGRLAMELANRRLPATDAFWDVLTITWPGGAVHTVDRVVGQAPNGR